MGPVQTITVEPLQSITPRFVTDTRTTERMGLLIPVERTLLLGMISGHFDMSASAELPDEDAIQIPVSAGIAVLATSERILEVLDDEELAAKRDCLDGQADGPAPSN